MAHDCPAGGDAHRRAAQPLLRGGCSTPTSRSGLQNALHRLGHAKRIKARIWGPWSSMGSTSRRFGRHGGIGSVRIGPHGIGASSPGAHADPGRTDAITDADYDGEQQRYTAEESARLSAPRRRACKAAGIRRGATRWLGQGLHHGHLRSRRRLRRPVAFQISSQPPPQMPQPRHRRHRHFWAPSRILVTPRRGRCALVLPRPTSLRYLRARGVDRAAGLPRGQPLTRGGGQGSQHRFQHLRRQIRIRPSVRGAS